MLKYCIFLLCSLLLFVNLVHNLDASYQEQEEYVSSDEDDHNKEKAKARIMYLENGQPSYIKCTRRFSPGKCTNEMESVWTFNVQEQNCTERLGCREPTRSNRFPTYFRCMKKCREVILIYSEILGLDTNISTRSMQLEYALQNDYGSKKKSRRFEGDLLLLDLEEHQRTQIGRDWYRQYRSEHVAPQRGRADINYDMLDDIDDLDI